jgi:formylglycine-generating enzyme required for sulfatase activity
MTPRSRSAIVVALAIAVATAPAVWSQQLAPPDGPLTQPQIEAALKVLTPRRVAGLIQKFGSTFILDVEGERRFRTAVTAAGKIDPALLEDIVRLLAPPRTQSPGMEWIAPTDRRRMVWIPAGAFQMGSAERESGRDADETRHATAIANGFWMESAEVTNLAFQKFVLANPEWQKERIDRSLHDGNYLIDWKGNQFPIGKEDAPVVNVSWYAARAYAAWAGKRLATEAEWEYACRAGSQSAYWWGESFAAAPAGATSMLSPVRNPWGLSAMLGGVWEWTASLYRRYPFVPDDGRNDPRAQGDRVSRGASGSSGPGMLRSANRNAVAPTTCSDLLGFRCVL